MVPNMSVHMSSLLGDSTSYSGVRRKVDNVSFVLLFVVLNVSLMVNK